MRKEILLAIVAGGILGLIIAFGIWRANSAFSPKGNSSTEGGNETPAPTNSPLVLASPEENEVVTETPVTVSGITKPSSLIAISGETKDYVISADTSGAFSVAVDLTSGLNQIVVYAFDVQNNAANTKLDIVYSAEFVKASATASPSASPSAAPGVSSEEGAVRQKVEEKVAAAMKVARAYIGTVTDISERTLQIKSSAGEIMQASVANDASVVKVGKATKEVKFGDIAIGDFVLALGYRNGNSVLEASRVLISSPISPTTRKAVIGTIDSLASGSINLRQGDQSATLSVTTDSTTKVTKTKDGKLFTVKTSDLNESDVIIVLGLPDSKNPSVFAARRIHVVTR